MSIDILDIKKLLKSGETISESCFSYNKANGIKIKRQAMKITIYVAPEKINYIEKSIKDYREILDIYIEEKPNLNDKILIRVNDNPEFIEKQIP